jgi:hypothetical protein
MKPLMDQQASWMRTPGLMLIWGDPWTQKCSSLARAARQSIYQSTLDGRLIPCAFPCPLTWFFLACATITDRKHGQCGSAYNKKGGMNSYLPSLMHTCILSPMSSTTRIHTAQPEGITWNTSSSSILMSSVCDFIVNYSRRCTNHDLSDFSYSCTFVQIPGCVYPNSNLLRQGCLSSSPTRISFVISLRTLELYHQLFIRQPRLSKQAWIRSICDYHNVVYVSPHQRRVAD